MSQQQETNPQYFHMLPQWKKPKIEELDVNDKTLSFAAGPFNDGTTATMITPIS